MNKFARFVRSPRAALAALAMSAGVAHAELPTEISSALATAKADGIALGTLVLVVILAIVAFKLLRKAI